MVSGSNSRCLMRSTLNNRNNKEVLVRYIYQVPSFVLIFIRSRAKGLRLIFIKIYGKLCSEEYQDFQVKKSL